MLNLKEKLPTYKKFKLSASAGKVMLVAFWDSHGIILAHYMPKGSNCDCYILFRGNLKKNKNKKTKQKKKKKLKEKLKKLRPRLTQKNVFFA